jgi:hypothetical protein
MMVRKGIQPTIQFSEGIGNQRNSALGIESGPCNNSDFHFQLIINYMTYATFSYKTDFVSDDFAQL